jgi:steroid delta-isomerase-like uncharacterized protein
MLKSKFFAFIFFTLILFSFLIYSGCQPQEERMYTDAELKAIWDNNIQLWNGGDVDLVDALYAEGCVRHNSDVGDSEGPEGVKEFVKWVYTAYPDFKVSFDKRFEFKDRIVAHWSATGTNNGPLSENMPATGKKVFFSGLAMSVIEDGKITEEWVYYNQLAIYDQMGYELILKEEVVE